MKKLIIITLLVFITTLLYSGDTKLNYSVWNKLSDREKEMYLNSLKATGDAAYYQSRYPYGSLDISYEKDFNPRGSSEKVFLIIEKQYYTDDSDLAPLFDRYALDMSYQNYAVYIYVLSSGNPTDLRNWIIANSSNLKGVMFVGDLAVAFYEHENDLNWGNHTEWPSDLFFGDLNGVYKDTDGDSIFDSFSGDIAPEIWISRLSLGQIDDDRYNDSSYTLKSQTINWLNNTHKYLRGTLKYGNRAANFIGEDWSNLQSSLNRLSSLYSNNIDLYIDDNFNQLRYGDAMSNSRNETIYLEIHSDPVAFGFTNPLYCTNILNNIVWNETVYDYSFNIQQIFSGLEACSACQFTYYNSANFAVGLSYLFAKYTICQTVLGLTKTSSLDNSDRFFYFASLGYNIGDCFIKWYRENYDKDKSYTHSYPEYWMSWNGGNILLGNPMIKLNHSLSYYTPNTPANNIDGNIYSVREGSELRIELPAVDYDGDSVSYVLNTQLANTSISGNVFSWTPSYTQGGITYDISIISNDGYEEYGNHIYVTVVNVKTIKGI